MRPIFQLNWQTHFGGGEVYTHFLCLALAELKIAHTLFIHPKAAFWKKLTFTSYTQLQPITHSLPELQKQLPTQALLITHGSLPEFWCTALTQKDIRVLGIAHMPLYGRNPNSFKNYYGVIPVSQYVLNSLRDHHRPNPYPKPWYGVASLQRNHIDIIIKKQTIYDWDKRKGRDRLLSWLEPLAKPFHAKTVYQKKVGLTLGIVSRITPIKQFPSLFNYLAPILKKHPEINIEIFGSGGYASIRDLKNALKPIKLQVRWWGQQTNVATVYTQLDFLLAGLPEKEALGLNIIEAQTCGLPILAVDALPFTETILNGKTGLLYNDPRNDQGQSFENIITGLLTKKINRPNPLQNSVHLAQFDLAHFTQRVEESLSWANA